MISYPHIRVYKVAPLYPNDYEDLNDPVNDGTLYISRTAFAGSQTPTKGASPTPRTSRCSFAGRRNFEASALASMAYARSALNPDG